MVSDFLKPTKIKILVFAFFILLFLPFIVMETNLLQGVRELPQFFDSNFFFNLFLISWIFYLPAIFLTEKIFNFSLHYYGENLYGTFLWTFLCLIIMLSYSYSLSSLIIFVFKKLKSCAKDSSEIEKLSKV